MPYKCVAAAKSTNMWNSWCELPQMSKAPGEDLSGNRAYIYVSSAEPIRV